MRGRKLHIGLVLLGAAIILPLAAQAQKYPERKHIRSGNQLFAEGRYAESEQAYREALRLAPESAEALFNLAAALYRQERYEEARQLYEGLSGSDAPVKSPAIYNSGNSLFEQEQLEEALRRYKEAVLADPSDMQARFNYAYVKKMLENDDQDQEQDGDDGGDRQQDRSPGPEEENGDGERHDGDTPDRSDQDDDHDGNAERDNISGEGMSREDAERLLDAMQVNEDRTREKVDEQQQRRVSPVTIKNW